MTQDSAPHADTSLAVHAFGELRGEISLLRRAVERLTDERTSQPDYAPSLEAIARRLEDVCVWARRVSERPAIKLTPETLASQIATAAVSSRADDQRLVKNAAAGMEATTSRIDAMIARSRSVTQQNRELLRNRVAFAVAGFVTFAILPGAVARSLPVSWAVPERIAARMLGTDMWGAGQRMMAKADPVRWNEIVVREQAQASSRK
jgi:hypothetical protein